ncbi:MAG: MipA/OmpV family protein [Phycisphaerae bacterium]|nr:MipA/OmpV family protein [Phycisphaerae bacterium]
MRNFLRILVLIAVSGVFIPQVRAQESVSANNENAVEPAGSTLNLGAGFVYRSPVYRGQDADGLPIPMIFYQKGNLYFRGSRLGYQFYKNDAFSLDVLAAWAFRGYDDDDSRHLNGMDDRDPSIEGGLAASYHDGWGTASVSFLTDLLGKHDGQELTFSYAKRFIREPWELTPSAGITWQSANLTDYYYGVEQKEVAAGRPRYSAGEAWNPFVALTTQYYFTEKWSSLVMLQYEWLNNEISDSPIVNKQYQVRVMAGIMCKF